MLRSPFRLFSLSLLVMITSLVIPCKAQVMPALPANQLILPPGDHEIPLQWQGDTVHAKWEPFAALLIPVKLPHCPEQYYMQFDLGSPYSLFYGDQLAAIRSKYPRALPQMKDSTVKLTNYHFNAGNVKIGAREIVVRWPAIAATMQGDKTGLRIIGTLGADLIDNKVAIIDYPEKRLFIGEHIPAAMLAGLRLSDFIFSGRRVLLPAVIKEEQTILYFDTGSSGYELLTDKTTWGALAAPGATPLQYQVKSWDNVLTANTVSTNDSINILSQKLPIRQATYIDGASEAQVAHMKKIGIGGMTGNKLFLNSVLILDTKHRKCGLIMANRK